MTQIPVRSGPPGGASSSTTTSIKDVHLRELFAARSRRGSSGLSVEAVGLFLDYSKHRVTDETMQLLVAPGRGVRPAGPYRRDVPRRQDQRHRGPRRAARRPPRAPRGQSILVDGEDVVPEVHEVLDRMAAFAERVRSGGWTGYTGQRIRNVVNIGIGGSDLGPVMAYEALRHYSQRDLTFRFVSNVDGTDFAEATRDLDPAETLFIVCSKTFTTLETMTNARTARDWLAGRARRRGGGRQALRGGLDQRARGRGLRHRHRQHVRLLGLGRRALLDGLGHRAVARCSPSGPTRFREMLAGLPRHGRALPHRAARPEPAGAHGPADALVHRLLRRADRRRCCPTTSTSSGSRPTCSSSPWSPTAST